MHFLARAVWVAGLAASSSLWAGLVFKTTRVELKPPAEGVASLDAEFPFANTGAETVRILETHAACGCTVPEIAEKTYAPGAAGVVKVRFDIGGRQGQQVKQVTIRTDAGDHLLTLVADLPQRLLVTPRLHVFRAGERDRVFKVEIRSDAPVKKIELGAPSPLYAAELVELKPGTDYEVRLKLAEDAPEDLRETLYVRTTGASGIDYVDSFFIRRTR